MATSAKQFYVGTPSTSNTILYTVPASTTAIVKNIVLTNTTGSDATITLQAAGKDLISSHTVKAKDAVFIDLNFVMNAGQTIVASQGTANAINVFISGVEMN